MITTQKMSISLPFHLYNYLAARVSPREMSSYIAQAVEHRMLEDKVNDSVENFLALREKMPKFKNKDILAAIHQGRR